MRRILLIIALFLNCISVYARPVSYPSGWTFMTKNDAERYSTHIHYSPTAFYSVGVRAEYWRDSDYVLKAIQINNLLKRWNKRKSQANIYLSSGLGIAYTDVGHFDSELSLAGFIGLSADWETRRFFVSYANRFTKAGSITENFRQSGRIGIAPYIADYGSIHTWLMVEFNHMPESSDQFSVTPLVRLFKGPNLLEGGISDQGDILFNFIHRF